MRRQRVAERLWNGGRHALHRWWNGNAAWIAAGETNGDKALRCVFLAIGIALLWFLVSGIPVLLWFLAPAWLWRAWKAGAPAAPKGTKETPEAEPPKDPENARAAVLKWVREGISDRNGVHLADLLHDAHSRNLLTHLDLAAFRSALERWGVPVRQQLKVGGRNRPGIHRDDLPPSPSPGGPRSAPTAAATTPTTSADTASPTYVYLGGRPTTGGEHDH